jgi:hypothetical protein
MLSTKLTFKNQAVELVESKITNENHLLVERVYFVETILQYHIEDNTELLDINTKDLNEVHTLL